MHSVDCQDDLRLRCVNDLCKKSQPAWFDANETVIVRSWDRSSHHIPIPFVPDAHPCVASSQELSEHQQLLVIRLISSAIAADQKGKDRSSPDNPITAREQLLSMKMIRSIVLYAFFFYRDYSHVLPHRAKPFSIPVWLSVASDRYSWTWNMLTRFAPTSVDRCNHQAARKEISLILSISIAVAWSTSINSSPVANKGMLISLNHQFGLRQSCTSQTLRAQWMAVPNRVSFWTDDPSTVKACSITLILDMCRAVSQRTMLWSA